MRKLGQERWQISSFSCLPGLTPVAVFLCEKQVDFGVHEASLKPESGVRLAEVFAELVVFDDTDPSWESCDHFA